MATAKVYTELAESLPPRLLRFFQRYPNRALYPVSSSPFIPATSSTPTTSPPAEPLPSVDAPSETPRNPNNINPFQAYRHPKTGNWHNPVFSLRRQAEIVKLAREHGVESLLPFTKKLTAERMKRKGEAGLGVKGTGVGQRVKGKAWERTMKGRLEKRRKAMLDMPGMIAQWKVAGHGRGWKKWPK